MLRIHETTREDGALAAMFLSEAGLVRDDGTYPLPAGAVGIVMKRYGGPLDPAEDVMEVGRLAIDGGLLRHVRHLARYDVIARDWLVWERAGDPAVVALANTVAKALEHLATRS